MKNLFFLPIILFFSISISGQDDNLKKSFKHEIGINISTLVDNIIFPNESYNFLPDDYFLTYKYHMEKFAIRTRIGGHQRSYNKENAINQNPSNRKGNSSEFNIALGIEKKSTFKNKWTYHYGIESIYHYNYFLHTNVGSTNGENPEIRDTKIGFGFGAILGFNYSIRPWISIGSESTFRFLSSAITSKYVFIDSINNIEGSSKETNSKFILSLIHI